MKLKLISVSEVKPGMHVEACGVVFMIETFMFGWGIYTVVGVTLNPVNGQPKSKGRVKLEFENDTFVNVID